MRSSDWSSDVCSSDLTLCLRLLSRAAPGRHRDRTGVRHRLQDTAFVRHEFLHRLDQLRDEVMTALHLDLNVAPRFVDTPAQADEPVVDGDHVAPDESYDPQHDHPLHVHARTASVTRAYMARRRAPSAAGGAHPHDAPERRWKARRRASP